jgi:hypothetical protein
MKVVDINETSAISIPNAFFPTKQQEAVKMIIFHNPYDFLNHAISLLLLRKAKKPNQS